MPPGKLNGNLENNNGMAKDTRIEINPKISRKKDALKHFQEKAFDFSFLEHEKNEVNIQDDICIAIIHGHNDVNEIVEDRLVSNDKEHHKFATREGMKNTSYKITAIKIIIFGTILRFSMPLKSINNR